VDEELVSGVDLAPTFLSVAGVPLPRPMHGRVLLGRDAQPEPRYVYAARDRMDEQSDTVRAVRDRRFKYIRNRHPERPYVRDLAFRDQMPMMQELRRLAAEERLEGAPALWFRARRDPEELYDTEVDPHEIRNLAADPALAAVLMRMRVELDRWLAASGDLGLLPEEELRRRFWPDGREPVTADPSWQRDADGRLALQCATPGASLELRLDGGPWRLYTEPVEAPPETRLQARAVRYGWAGSGEASARVP
jgi:hypothetical protein